MPQTLNSLEAQRSTILQQFLGLGDLRPGSISAVAHRCGKSYCHCAQPKDPGHEPQIRVLRKVHGKSVAETLSSPTAFRKAQEEVSEFHRFQELSAELVTINEKICRLRPLEQEPGSWNAEEKKRLLRSIRKSRGK
jgi:Family of unknown function (DUF6788)